MKSPDAFLFDKNWLQVLYDDMYGKIWIYDNLACCLFPLSLNLAFEKAHPNHKKGILYFILDLL